MITLVLGGSRSGKSVFAERLAGEAGGSVTYVATARVDAADTDHVARIEAHRQRRPAGWHTLECPDPSLLAQVLGDVPGTVLLDSLGTWVAGHPGLDPDPHDLLAALGSRSGHSIVVSEEVGLAPHAPTEAGRHFADALGTVNQAVSAIADRAFLVVAGRALELPPTVVLSALGFLTVTPGTHRPDERTLRWFPVVGALIGAVLALVWMGGSEIWSPEVVAVLVVAVDLAVTGLLHVDGLADSADGLLSHLDRDRRLDVMRRPDVGAFALAVVPVVLLARWAALAGDLVDPVALVGVWMTSRTIMAVVPAVVPYARDHGLASPFLAGAHRWFAVWVVPAALLVLAPHGVGGLVALLAGVAAAAVVVERARRCLGGFTGDVLGAAAVVAETVTLLALTAR